MRRSLSVRPDWIVLMLWCALAAHGPGHAGEVGGYRLAPRDKLTITVLRHEELSGTYTIPPDGALDLPRVGRVQVGGLTTPEVAAAVKTGLAQLLRDPDVTVVLVEARTQTTFALGAVSKPGQYALTAGARLTDLLAAAGDLVGEREKLTAHLIRGASTLPVQLTAALSGQAPEANLPLQEGDLLWVQAPALITVVVSGQVKTPGSVRLRDGATLLDALAAAGDVSGEREKLTASLLRNGTMQPLDLANALFGTRPAANLRLHDGDLLWIQPQPQINIMVTGAVKTPGAFKLETGATVRDALAKAGDLSTEKDRVSLSLVRDTQTLPLTWQDTTRPLHDGDLLLVDPEPRERVYVNGHVKNPGAIELPEQGGVLEAIALAGGVLENPALHRVTIIRRNGTTERVNLAPALLEGNITANPQLGPEDQVIVPQSTTTIAVLGMVRQPGRFSFNETKPLTLAEAISLAGGAQERGELGKVLIVRQQDGKPQQLTLNLKQMLKAGSTQLPYVLQAQDIVYVPEAGFFDFDRIVRAVSLLGYLAF
jgi:polysaccharide export outer membrane protein